MPEVSGGQGPATPDETAGSDREEDILVIRSKLDADVWIADVRGSDMRDHEHPGRLRAVRRWAAATYAWDAVAVRWVRVDADTWRMCATYPDGGNRG